VEMCELCAVQDISYWQRRSKRLLKRLPARALDYVLDLHSYAQSVTALLGQKLSRCQQRSRRLLKNAPVCAITHLLDLQSYAQLITASLGRFAHATASCARASAQQRPAGRQTPTKRRQQCSSPAPGAAAAAKPSRQARRRLRNRAAAAQNTTAAADNEHTATAAALHSNKAPEQGNEAVAEAADTEHSTTPIEQLHGSPDPITMYAAIKPSSVAEVRDCCIENLQTACPASV
jgi:hypothetical protein